jgi:tRNA(Leu) C34 or U34 (ribose-2'-O)-methylase TrmL
MYVDPFEPANLHWPNIVHHKTLESAMASTGDVPWVFLEYNEPSSIALPDFEHPEDVVYCFGSDRRGLDEIDRSLGQWVNIPTYDSLYANQAAAIVLAHRKFIS